MISGGYEDDIDLGDKIIYTGHGGNDPASGKQIDHQNWNAPGNKGLIVSKIKNIPIRVIRGFKSNSVFSPKSGYVYAGLFTVKDYRQKMGKSGFLICQFELEKLKFAKESISVREGTMVKLEPLGKEPQWISIGVDAPQTRKISSESKMAQLLSGKKEGETIDFGAGFKVLEIRKYLSQSN